MKHIVFTLMSIPCAMISMVANAADTNHYVGVGLGQSSYSVDYGYGIDETKNEKSTGAIFFAGVEFNPYFAIEGGYGKLGNATLIKNVLSASADGRFSVGPYKGETTALYASAKAKLKINGLFSVYGKLGVSRNSTSCFKSVDLPMQANVATTLVYSSTCHTTGGFSAFGAEYKITENTAVGAEYTNFNRILPFSSHANLLSLNVHFYF